METVRILFVCHGNICRSAMAEFILKALVMARGVEYRYYIDSAAVSKLPSRTCWKAVKQCSTLELLHH